MKLKWTIAPAPTGQYRSFTERGWPTAEFPETDRPAAHIACADEYVPSKVKTADHAPLDVFIAKYATAQERKETGCGAFTWQKAKKQATTLAEAKKLAADLLEKFPHFWPEELRDE